MDSGISQVEAERLLALQKEFEKAKQGLYTAARGKFERKVLASAGPERFVLNYSHNAIEFQKVTYHFRDEQKVGLARLDLGDQRHRNPDGVMIDGPHLHVYREDFNLRWAVPMPSHFAACTSFESYYYSFLSWCSIAMPRPPSQLTLFE